MYHKVTQTRLTQPTRPSCCKEVTCNEAAYGFIVGTPFHVLQNAQEGFERNKLTILIDVSLKAILIMFKEVPQKHDILFKVEIFPSRPAL
jgi:hypothetical protein